MLEIELQETTKLAEVERKKAEIERKRAKAEIERKRTATDVESFRKEARLQRELMQEGSSKMSTINFCSKYRRH